MEGTPRSRGRPNETGHGSAAAFFRAAQMRPMKRKPEGNHLPGGVLLGPRIFRPASRRCPLSQTCRCWRRMRAVSAGNVRPPAAGVTP